MKDHAVEQTLAFKVPKWYVLQVLPNITVTSILELKMATAIGIDLGTTNSCTAVKKIQTQVLKNSEGDYLTPSSVTLIPAGTEEGQWKIGKPSLQLRKLFPDETILSVKRLMGRSLHDPDVKRIQKESLVGYKLLEDKDDPNSIVLDLGKERKKPEEISSLLLEKLALDASHASESDVDQVVVTVPAYFNDQQKYATQRAVENAGLKLLRLLPEPTAAAISFGVSDEMATDGKTVMVFDLGGGTFDISILNIAAGQYMEITKGGDMWLGGDDIDRLIMNFAIKETEKSEGCSPIKELLDAMPPKEKARFLAQLREKAEQAKIQLSHSDSTVIDCFGILKDKEGQLIDIDVTLNRADYEKLITPMMEKLLEVSRAILKSVDFEVELIDKVLMVGGSSQIPLLQRKLKDVFGSEKVICHPRPMYAICEGAAIMAQQLAGRDLEQDRLGIDVMHSTAHDYFLKLAGGKRHLLVARNTPLPFSIKKSFKFSNPEQLQASIRIYNEADNIFEMVGEMWLFKRENLSYTYDGHEDTLVEKSYELEFSIDANNIINLVVSCQQGKNTVVKKSSLVRGSHQQRLYFELDKVIEKASLSESPERILDMAQIIGQMIEEGSDIKSASRRLFALSEFMELDFDPLSALHEMQIILKYGVPFLTPDQQERLKQMKNDMHKELERFADFKLMQQLVEQFEDLIDGNNDLSFLLVSESLAAGVEMRHKRTSKEIRQNLIDWSRYRAQGDAKKEQMAKNRIDQLSAGFTYGGAGLGSPAAKDVVLT